MKKEDLEEIMRQAKKDGGLLTKKDLDDALREHERRVYSIPLWVKVICGILLLPIVLYYGGIACIVCSTLS
jgi:hypothetical protein